MPKFYQTVATRIEKEKAEAFKELCDKEGCSPHMKLKDYIFGVLGEKKNVRRSRKMEKTRGDIRRETRANDGISKEITRSNNQKVSTFIW